MWDCVCARVCPKALAGSMTQWSDIKIYSKSFLSSTSLRENTRQGQSAWEWASKHGSREELVDRLRSGALQSRQPVARKQMPICSSSGILPDCNSTWGQLKAQSAMVDGGQVMQSRITQSHTSRQRCCHTQVLSHPVAVTPRRCYTQVLSRPGAVTPGCCRTQVLSRPGAVTYLLPGMRELPWSSRIELQGSLVIHITCTGYCLRTMNGPTTAAHRLSGTCWCPAQAAVLLHLADCAARAPLACSGQSSNTAMPLPTH